MPTFFYKATDTSGKIIDGTIEAKDESVVVDRLHEQGYYPIQIGLPSATRGDLISEGRIKALLGRVGGKDVLNFTQQLAILLEAAVPLDVSLSTLVELSRKGKFQNLVRKILEDVHAGVTFSDSLAKYPSVFSKMYVRMVRSGEASGNLSTVLSYLAEFLERSQRLREEIISALIYPILITLVSLGAIGILITTVVPRFATIFENMGQQMPMTLSVLILLSEGIKSYWWAGLGTLSAGILLYRHFIKDPEIRLTLDSWKLKIPLVKNFVQGKEVARFSRTLGTLIAGGVPLLPALQIVREVVENTYIASQVRSISERITEGQNISRPLGESQVFPPMAVRMLAVGEEVGKLVEMLFKIADIYDEEVRRTLNRFIRLIEPLIIVIMGLIVGLLVYSIATSIFSISNIPF
jgi:general secretion pathway protein F